MGQLRQANERASCKREQNDRDGNPTQDRLSRLRQCLIALGRPVDTASKEYLEGRESEAESNEGFVLHWSNARWIECAPILKTEVCKKECVQQHRC